MRTTLNALPARTVRQDFSDGSYARNVELTASDGERTVRMTVAVVSRTTDGSVRDARNLRDALNAAAWIDVEVSEGG